MNASLWLLVAVLVLAAGSMAVGLARTRERGERYEPRHLPRFVEEPPEQDFYGSMSHDEERTWRGGAAIARDALRYLPAPYPLDPVPWEDLQSDARIEAGPDWREQTAADLAPAALDPGPGVVAPSHGPPPSPDQGQAIQLQEHFEPGLPTFDGLPVYGVPGLAGDWVSRPSEPTRLADTDEIAEARGWPTTRDQDADVADWLASRAIVWARLEIGVLT